MPGAATTSPILSRRLARGLTHRYRLTPADIEQMERDHRIDSAGAVLAWLNEAGHGRDYHEIRDLGRVEPEL